MEPRRALQATGKRATWVAAQMGIDRTLLWRMFDGQRPWLPAHRKRFALAIGLAEDVIEFPDYKAAEAPSVAPARRNPTEQYSGAIDGPEPVATLPVASGGAR